ncbi:hypothetical protein [Siphonobacter sp. SORGH_AS_1065]|uniref:hypothetical protein n=1 Tax=Siphonobacter sp. SORGH_AS_1065 TaxID=3041795 RepID=UPI0027805393|nr:hypothetical protein [Siphonobacter sp. SORGH_AS_1065]MDQ1087140.1 hypothetical protein [Siphonobacter sp. SORGH_AS_1065]
MSFFNLERYHKERQLTRSDVVIGSILSAILLTLFALGSSGMSLIATFIPGILFAWLLFVFMYFKEIELPDYTIFLPQYFLALGWQFIHFAEEFITNFRELFPVTYGGQPYAANSFVAFNMLSYFVFIGAPILVYFRGLKFLFIPVLFFIVYGVMGNAIAHSWWSAYLGAYFPGLYTSLAYWLLGPMVLATIVRSKKIALIYILLLTAILIVTLTLLMA